MEAVMLISYLSSGGNEYQWFRGYVETAIKILLENNEIISGTDSRGGYLSIFQPKSDFSPRMEYLIACGNFPTEKTARYMYLSSEKSVRLNSHLVDSHVTSRESANENNEEYPGSIYLEEEERIYSFSGLLPEWDEFMSTMVSSFNYYLRQRSGFFMRLEGVPGIFKSRMHLITASPTQKSLMLAVVEKIVALEIEKRQK